MSKPASVITLQPQNMMLQKGDLLFKEGDHSTAMYYLKSGIIRIFKKKGDTNIEIEQIRAGQILGELAFLDGNPRSASGEAMTRCELVEISTDLFSSTMKQMPDWVKLLLKTVVGRLRSSSTKIRQLEQASKSFDFDARGQRKAHYTYLSATDVMKVSLAILLVGARNGIPMDDDLKDIVDESEKEDKDSIAPPNEEPDGEDFELATQLGVQIKTGLVQRYANQIMGVPVAKITTMLDVLAKGDILKINATGTKVVLVEPDLLEDFVTFYNEQNLGDPAKRKDLTVVGFLIMTLVHKHLHEYSDTDNRTGKLIVNIKEVMQTEARNYGQDPFRIDDANELVKVGYFTQLQIKDTTRVLTTLDAELFKTHFKYQKIARAIANENEKKEAQVSKKQKF